MVYNRRIALGLAATAFALGVVALETRGSRAQAFYAPNRVRIPPLEERPRPGPVDFSHWSHNQYQCYACHPSIFPQHREGFTHDEMADGRYCGSCHNGQEAFPARARCSRCHGETR
ncbi:MAG: cytochrome c3 family protein [Myxococcota bacterium]